MFFKKPEVIKFVGRYGVYEADVETLEGIEFIQGRLETKDPYIWLVDRENKELIPADRNLKELSLIHI